MAVSAVDTLLDTLRHMQLVPTARLDELARNGASFAEPRELARHLLDRGLLTPFQINHLLQNRAAELQLGPYLLLERLGEGSRGQVFKAQHQRMRRIVALKLIRKELLADADAVQRFYQEIESASQLSHSYIVHAYDAGPIGATHFLAMEFVEGIDLARQMERSGPLPWEQAAAYIVQAALGLQHAFEKGMVHRGISPANLFVTGAHEEKETSRSRKGKKGKAGDPSSWGMVKIMDFGQGRLLGAELDLDRPRTPSDPGRGLLDFQAPEKALGRAVDIRSDIYSLGCTFHYLLTGQTPRPTPPTVPQEDNSHWRELQPIAALPEELPESVAAVLGRMTAILPDHRYQTPDEVAKALSAAGVHFSSCITAALSGALPVPRAAEDAPAVSSRKLRQAAESRWQGLVIWGGGAALLIGVVVLGLLFFLPSFGSRSTDTETAETTPAAAELKRLESVIHSKPDADEVWSGLLALRAKYPETPEAQAAADWLQRVPSPLDKLSADKIPEAERYPWQKDVVAVLGEQRWRQWTGGTRLLAVSPTGQQLASAGDLDTVYLWEMATGHPQHFLRTEHGRVQALAFSPDGKTLATCGDDRHIRLWNTATGAEVGPALLGHGGPVYALAYSPDGKWLVSGGSDKKVLLWDWAKNKWTALPGDHKDYVLTVAFAPDGRTIASGSKDGAIKLWDVESKKVRAVLPGHPGGVLALAFDPRDAGQLASAGVDKVVRIWDTIADRELKVLRNHTSPVNCLAYTPDGRKLVTGSVSDVAVRLWDLSARPEQAPVIVKQDWPPGALAFSVDGQKMIVGLVQEQTAIRFWEMAGLKPLPPPQGHTRAIRSLAFTPNGQTLISLSSESDPHFWSLPDLIDHSPPGEGPSSGMLAMALAPNGKTLATPARDGKQVRLWDVAGAQVRLAFGQGHTSVIESLAFSPDGNTVASGARGKGVQFRDVATGAEKCPVLKWDQIPHVLLYSRDGQTLIVAGDYSPTVLLWDPIAHKEKQVLHGLDQGAGAAALSPDGKLLATSGRDNLIRLWELSAGRERAGPPIRVPQQIRALLFTPDSQKVIAASRDGTIVLWRVLSGDPSRALGLPSAITSLALAPDGRHLAVGGGNGAIYIFRLAPPTLHGE